MSRGEEQPQLRAIKPVAKAEVPRHHFDGAAAAVRAVNDDAAPPRPAVTREECGGGRLDAFVLRNVLPRQVCEELVSLTDELGYTFWHPNHVGHDFRSAHTVEVTHEALAQSIWERVRDHVNPEVSIVDESDPRWERDIQGTWRAVGINSKLLFARYGEGAHFSPHTDGYTIIDFNRRSLYSVLLYLNTCEHGGATRMMEPGTRCEFVRDEGKRWRWPEDRVVASARVETGTALLFYQDIPHEGEPVEAGRELRDGQRLPNSKYLIRTDVIYERVEGRLCDTDAGAEAFRLFREAELMEADGDCEAAARLYRRCFKMSPELAAVYGS
mmetsp:Transcript_181/g.587  ORF Transcript_181/g.587 Transcript_181/m.587 type:complete len:327 (-) Transcript_181:109-1089(-)